MAVALDIRHGEGGVGHPKHVQLAWRVSEAGRVTYVDDHVVVEAATVGEVLRVEDRAAVAAVLEYLASGASNAQRIAVSRPRWALSWPPPRISNPADRRCPSSDSRS